MQTRFARLQRSPQPPAHVELADGVAHVLDRAPWLGGARTGEQLAGYDGEGRGALGRLCPVEPRKILCIGRNYAAHAKELGNEVPKEPMLFYKPSTSLLDPGGTIVLPPSTISERVEHEAELALVIGRRLQRADEAEAAAAIFGLTLACDVTARDLQKKDGQWWRAKGMDTFCPVGPVVVAGLSWDDLEISCSVNDELRQRGRTSAMIFKLPAVLAHVSRSVTLEPGDVILTGTPEGTGPLRGGDRLHISIPEIGSLDLDVAVSA